MAVPMSAATKAEIERKAAAGIKLTNTSNAANTAYYNSLIPAPQKTTVTAQGAAPRATGGVPAPNLGNNGVGSRDQLNASHGILQSGNLAAIQAEIARSQGIMNDRSKAGQDTSVQNAWLGKLNNAASGLIPKPSGQAQAAPTTSTPMPSNYGNNMAYNVGTNQDREAEAARQVAAALAEKARIAAQQKASLATTYGNQLQDIQQNRTLENITQQRVANPFSGKTAWNQGIQNMERAEADSQLNNLYNTNVANVDAALAEYQNLSMEERQRIQDELTRQDREFGLNQGSLTGNYGGGRTLAGQQFDWGQTIDEANLTGIYNGKKTAAQQQQDIQNQQWQQSFNAQNDQWKQAFDMQNGQWQQEFKQKGDMWKSEFDENARRYNQDYALQKLAQDHNMTIDQAQLAISRQNANTSASSAAWARDPRNPDNVYKNAQINELQNKPPTGSTKAPTTNEYYAEYTGNLDKLSPAVRKRALEENKTEIISKIGLSGYNSLYTSYFPE